MKPLVLLLSILLIVPGVATAIPNPAAVYCIEQGYEYENGVCIFPDGSECGAWQYYCKCEPNGIGCWQGDFNCAFPCRELSCREAGQFVSIGKCCPGLAEIPRIEAYDDQCNLVGWPGWVFLCSDCGNGICENWESICNCPQDCAPVHNTTQDTYHETIQAAIDNAFDGDTVIVADGTYTGEGNRDIDFLGKAITVRSESGPQNCVIDCQTLGSAFYFHSGEEADSLLDGFTITNGHGGIGGGGIFCSSTSPTVVNCVITNNAGQVVGGGLCFRGGKPTITDCMIKGNFADKGAGIYCDNNSSPIIANCTISENSADSRGGAIYCKNTSSTLINCTLAGNSTTYFGGAMYIIDSNIALKDCTFTGNSAEDGGAVYNRESTVTIDACTFKRNWAESSGGALYNGRGTQKVTSSLFTGNSASSGGAIMNAADRIINCTFTGNSAYSGGAISESVINLFNAGPIDTPIENCILWGDTPDEIRPAGQWWHLSDADAVWSYVKFSNVQGGYPGEGNIDAEPCFIEPGYWDANGVWVDGDYHLLADSPCIDTGDPNYVAEPNETDLDGNPRIVNDRIDMGAYEYIPPVEAELKLTPQMLNCESEGRWVKAHITLPEEYSPEDIDVNTPAVADPPGVESEFIEVNEYSDGSFDVQIYFDREIFCQALSESEDGLLEVTVTGLFIDGRKFQGSDTIRLKSKPWQHRIRKDINRKDKKQVNPYYMDKFNLECKAKNAVKF